MPNKAKGTDSPPSDAVLLATIQRQTVWAMTWRWVLLILSLGVLLWMATPLAREIAGKNTTFDVSISLAANVTLALTTIAGYGYGARQRNRAKHLEGRNNRLNERVEGLQKELEEFKMDR